MAKTLDEAGVKRLIQEIKGANKNLNTPIFISTENTTESMAKNVKNIADYVEKAKAAGIANVNGMGVTCMMDDYYHYSGVGYLFLLGEKFIVQGVLIKDDLVENMCFALFDDGTYFERGLIVSGNDRVEVSSDMLAKGARKPIILTSDTTEVDEETYQKLLSDDVDVVFKTSDGNICTLTYKYENETEWKFVFTCFSLEGVNIDNTYLLGFEVAITKNSPHTYSVSINSDGEDFRDFINNAGYLNKSTLTPILQEIDLTGTDAERKAKLDKFETDWKALTGASDLAGARFVGSYINDNGLWIVGVFNYGESANYSALTPDENGKPYVISLELDGSLTITPLFSHLQSVYLYKDNTTEHIQHNQDAIQAYLDNLNALGIPENAEGSIMPIYVSVEDDVPSVGFLSMCSQGWYNGYITTCGGGGYSAINVNAGSVTLTPLAISTDLLDKADKTKVATSLEAITLYTDNTAEHMQANLDNIAAYEANLQALGVDTSKGIIIPTKAGDYIGWLSYNNDMYSGIYTGDDFATQYVMSVDSEGRFSDVFIPTENDLLEYKSLNAKSLEAITIKTGNTTSDKADNKAAIQAYVDNLKALGVDMTKGYTIPVYIDGIGSGFLCQMGNNIIYYVGVMNMYGASSFGIAVDAGGGYFSYKLQTETDNSLTTTSKKIVGAINEVNTLAKAVKAFGAIELKASDNDSNKAAITAYLKILTDAGVSTTNGYSVPVRITGNSQEYHGMLNIGTGVLLSGVVTDVNENHHYPFNVSTTDGVITFDESNYFLEKTSNEVTEMLDAIKYSHTSVPFTDTTLSNKAQLEVFLSKVPDATVMHCTYKEIWAGTLHKINGDWYGLLVKNTNNPADNINIKLSADGTVITSNSAQ